MFAQRKTATWGWHEEEIMSCIKPPVAFKGAAPSGIMVHVKSPTQRSSGLGRLEQRSSSSPALMPTAASSSGCRAGSLRTSALGSLGAFSLQSRMGSTVQDAYGNQAGARGGSDLYGLGAYAEQARLLEERCVRLSLAIESEVDIGCWVSLEQGETDGPELPLVIQACKCSSASFKGGSEGIYGTITLEGFTQCLPFRVGASAPSGVTVGNGLTNFVIEPGQLRATVMSRATQVGCSLAGEAGAHGMVVELQLTKNSLSKMTVSVRCATEVEACRQRAREQPQ